MRIESQIMGIPPLINSGLDEHNCFLLDTYLVRSADGDDNTITESFSSSDNPYLYVGTISEPVSDPSQNGEIELTYINPDSDEYNYTESVILVEEDYPEE